jgi:tripartite-type tricarboxylate transporter receptor subunit TctC
MHFRVIAAVAAGLVIGLSDAQAQDYPTKSITMIVPFAAGGPTDTVARMVGQSMSKTLKQQIVIENVGGAGGTLGAARAAKASPDGYTVFLHHIGQATSATLYRKLPYDTIGDFEPIGLVTEVPMTLVARRDYPPANMKDLIVYVKENKEKVNLGNAGIGAASHLCGMLFQSSIQTPLTTIPYKGTGPAMNDLLGGQIDLMCDQTTNTTGQIKGGGIKVYAVTTKQRIAILPDIPTMAESGFPNFEVTIWHGMYAPKGTPKPAIDKLAGALQVALEDENVKTRFAELGTEPVSKDRATPEALRAHLKAEIEKWRPVIQAAGIYAD